MTATTTPCPWPGCEVAQQRRPYATKNDGIPSVTTVIDVLDDHRSRSFGWAASAIAARVAVHEGDSWIDMDRANCHPETKDFCVACRFIRSQFDRDWRTKADLGTHCHHIAESWATGAEAEVDDASAPYVDALEKFYVEHAPEFLFTEQTVSYGQDKPDQRSHRFRGTFDAIAWLSVGRERDRWLLDWKTSSGVYPAAYTMQMAAYKGATALTDWSEGSENIIGKMPRVDHCGVVWLRADGEFRLVELPVDGNSFGHFLRVIDLYHYQRRMDAWTRAHAADWEEER